MKLAPSILTMDFLEMGSQLKMLEEEGIEVLHLDVMDGCFVPNLTFGPPLVQAFRKVFHGTVEAHLMIDKPEVHVEAFAKAGCDRIIVSYESSVHIHRLLQQVRELDVEVGLAINPGTPLSVCEPLLDELDLILVITVNPGFGGQKYIQAMDQKIKSFQAMRKDYPKIQLEIDGGVKKEGIARFREMGVDLAVVGSAIFNPQSDPRANVRELMKQ